MEALKVGGVFSPEDDETECRDRDGESYPEHDYDDFQCRRCGAEPDDLPG